MDALTHENWIVPFFLKDVDPSIIGFGGGIIMVKGSRLFFCTDGENELFSIHRLYISSSVFEGLYVLSIINF